MPRQISSAVVISRIRSSMGDGAADHLDDMLAIVGVDGVLKENSVEYTLARNAANFIIELNSLGDECLVSEGEVERPLTYSFDIQSDRAELSWVRKDDGSRWYTETLIPGKRGITSYNDHGGCSQDGWDYEEWNHWIEGRMAATIGEGRHEGFPEEECRRLAHDVVDWMKQVAPGHAEYAEEVWL